MQQRASSTYCRLNNVDLIHLEASVMGERASTKTSLMFFLTQIMEIFKRFKSIENKSFVMNTKKILNKHMQSFFLWILNIISNPRTFDTSVLTQLLNKVG